MTLLTKRVLSFAARSLLCAALAAPALAQTAGDVDDKRIERADKVPGDCRAPPS